MSNTKNSTTSYVDLLEEDKPIAGQKFVCLSFVSPENIIKNKNIFFFEKFLKQWDLNKSLEKYTQFLNYISFKYNLVFDDLQKELQDFCKEEKDNLFITTLDDEFKTYVDNNEEKLENEYSETCQFQTTTRGIKVRGTYPTQQEAELRCKMLREVDPNHDVYVGPVGVWMPFHPEAYKTGRVEYLEDELNKLMHEKDKNERNAKEEFEKRVKESKQRAYEENKKKAMDSGNVLTQTIDENGNLISVNNVNTIDSRLGENVSVTEIQKELFDSSDVVLDYKNSDHGLSQFQQ